MGRERRNRYSFAEVDQECRDQESGPPTGGAEPLDMTGAVIVIDKYTEAMKRNKELEKFARESRLTTSTLIVRNNWMR